MFKQNFILNILNPMTLGFQYIYIDWQNTIMIIIGCILLYIAIAKKCEPLLLIPIGFSCILVNIPFSDLMLKEDSFLNIIYNIGIDTDLFPLLIFIGIGSMTDFEPLLSRPLLFILGVCGQLGVFLTLLLALYFGFTKLDAVSIAMIGACDGPTAIYVASNYTPHLLSIITIVAYSYITLVPIIQPPIMKIFTTKNERKITMKYFEKPVSKKVKLLFPLITTLICGYIAPNGLPLLGTIMLGNFMKESGVVNRLTKASENEITNIITLFLGLAIGSTMSGKIFIKNETLIIFGLGFLAICLDTICGILSVKIYNIFVEKKVNPLIGAAAISAFPTAARIVQKEGFKYNNRNYLLMHAVGVNTSGQLASIIVSAVILRILSQLGLTC